jgi:hypothetical protein
MGGGAVQGGRVGRLLVGAAPRVWGREWAAGIRFRGAWRPSGGASTAGRWPWGPARLASPPAPRPPRCVTGKRNREIGIRMVADGWGPLGSETRREMKGRRAGWLCWAEMHRRAAA